MKNLKIFLVSIFVFFVSSICVSAAGSASISVSKSTIENGSKVTASVTISVE